MTPGGFVFCQYISLRYLENAASVESENEMLKKSLQFIGKMV